MKNRKFLIGVIWLVAIGIIITSILLVYLVFNNLEQGPQDTSTQSLSTPTPIPFEGQAVNLIWFYKPPKNGNLTKIAENFDMLILTSNDEDERDELKEMGISTPVLQYLSFEAIQDPGSCDKKPFQNQVANRAGDFCYISEHYPDWFLLDFNGERMIGDGYVIMDPGNQEWRAFWLERAIQSQEYLGWDGVFLDNVEASLSKRARREQLPAAYLTDASYQTAVLGFLQYIYINYFQPQQRPLMANIIALDDPAVWFEYLQYLDGAMEEGWGVDWHDGYHSPEMWESHLYRSDQTQAMGKTAILVSQGSQADAERQIFAYASYLLTTYGKAVFRYTNAAKYHEIWLYPNYELDLGEPMGSRYFDGTLWHRDFTNGTVRVDPEKNTAIIETFE